MLALLLVLAGGLTAVMSGAGPAWSFHGGSHTGTYKVWSLNESIGFDPHETVDDVASLSNQLPGPVMITAMENGFLSGGPCGNLYWNPVTNQFRYYGVTGGFQFPIDLDRRASLSTGAGSFGGGNVWTSVNGNVSFAPYVQFRGTGNMRRYDLGAFDSTGIRVNQSNGKVYLGNFSPGQLIELDPTTNAVKKWSTGNSPYFLELDAVGNVYATAVAGGGFPDQIIRLNPVTNVITRWTIPFGGLQGFISFGTPNFITEDNEANLWFSESASDEYGRLNPVTNVFEEFTKPGLDNPHGIATSGAGPTLQLFGEEAFGNTSDVLTRAAASPTTTFVIPFAAPVAPVTSTATFADFTEPPADVTITPSTTIVTSSDPSGIDRFPEPAGVSTPTSSTSVLFTNTILGSVEGTDDVQQFTSSIIFPVGAEAAKVTGGFMYAVPGGAATGGFNVQRKEEAGPVSGQYEYHNHATGENVHSVTIDTLVVSDTDADGKPDTATFSGSCTNNGVPCTFEVKVEDKGEPGTSDTHQISGVVIVPTSGTLMGGNIQIHKKK